MVYYRTYRPQTIEDFDSSAVRKTLTAALSSKDTPHAFLFTGPKGLGKTSAARLVAKVVNCEENSKLKSQKSKAQVKTQNLETIEPCNKCTQCRSITNGTNLDVFEIDAASNRGIDEIRDLREKIRLLPSASSKKVYIIDEVHMLTTEAFNALLKTLEEPPPHALFVLCTTEPQKMPATIISRCFHVQFKKATAEELVRSFERIAKGEKLKVEKAALQEIAKLSDGSFRDGAKTLEELVLLAKGSSITKELIEEKYQTISMAKSAIEMTFFLKEKNAKSAVKLISELTQKGVDIKYFIEQLISLLHKALLVEVGVEKEDTRLPLTIDEIRKIVPLLAEAHTQTKYAVIPALPLEIAILEYTQNKTEQNAEQNGNEAQRSSASSSASISDNNIKKQTNSGTTDIWGKLINTVKAHNHSIAGVLRGCSLDTYDDKNFIITTKFQFHKEKLEEKKAKEILEKAVEEINGKKVMVSVLLKKD